MHFLLFYEKTSGYAERQKPLVTAHIEYLQGQVREGHLVLAGNLSDPADGSALLLYKAESAAQVEAFARGDPFVVHGIISKWWVRNWVTVLGKEAVSPLP